MCLKKKNKTKKVWFLPEWKYWDHLYQLNKNKKQNKKKRYSMYKDAFGKQAQSFAKN